MTDDPAPPIDPSGQSQDESTQHPLILASRVEKTPVYATDGEHIGHVADISLEKASGRAVYGIMSFGGFLGIGARFHPVPWAMLTYEPDKGGFVIPMDKAELAAAPHYERDDLDRLGGAHRQFDSEMYSFYARYGITPYG